MQYSLNSSIYYMNAQKKKFTHNLLIPRLNFFILTRGSSPNKGSACENRAFIFYLLLYLQCFSIKASTFGSPNSLALAKLAQASLFSFI